MRRAKLLTGLVLLNLAASAMAQTPVQSRKPNVIVIVTDDQGYGDVGFNGCKDIPTPNLDALARSGTICTSGYVTFPVCSPSRVGLLTGRHGARFGYDTNPDSPQSPNPHAMGLPLSERTLPEVLQKVGYQTGGIGKWHLGVQPHFHPNQRGFGEFFGFLGGGHQSLNWVENPNNPYQWALLRNTTPVPGVEKRYLTEVLTDEATAFVERHQKEPFFLYLAYNAPHEPLQAPESYLARFPNLTGKRKTYAAMVSAVDDGVGKLTAKLKELGLTNDTLVVYISDNGGPINANASRNLPLRGEKSQVLEGGIRVPFVLSYPGTIPAGKRYDQPVSTLDIQPTALALAGKETQHMASMEGVNLIPFLRGESKEAPHERLYWRHINGSWAIREGAYKLMSDAKGVQSLFDLTQDIGEKNNLLAQKPEIAKRLQRAWETWNASNAGRIPWAPNTGGLKSDG